MKILKILFTVLCFFCFTIQANSQAPKTPTKVQPGKVSPKPPAYTKPKNGSIKDTTTTYEFAPIADRDPGQIYKPRVRGYVDMHTHLMSHLAFGGKIMYGTPDPQAPALAGTFFRGSDISHSEQCNTSMEPAGSMARALGDCNVVHGGWGMFDNNCGDPIRQQVVNDLDKNYIFKTGGLIPDHLHKDGAGYPHFKNWPHQSSVTHQQMWYEWLERAHKGGLNIMVALAENNSLLAKLAGAGEYIDDNSSIKLQLREIKNFVNRHSGFMEIAKSPEDALRIIKAKKLAVILGVETDDIGNFARRAKFGQHERITIEHVKAELKDLYNNYDVRYIFPIHVADNLFGGTAVYDTTLALSTKYYTNHFIEVESVRGRNIGYKHGKKRFDKDDFLNEFTQELIKSRDLGDVISNQPNYPAPPAGSGHVNKRGLTTLGTAAIVEMMNLGMMIDIDHMSEKSMLGALAASKLYARLRGAEFYPLNAGHNGIRGDNGTERNLHPAVADSIFKTGGMIGVGTANATPNEFVQNFMNVYNIRRSPNIAFGSDVNGMEPLPKQSPGLNSDAFYAGFPLGKIMRENGFPWDYTNEGVAHYGLMPEFFHDVKGQPNGENVSILLNNSADRFITMWEKCVKLSRR